MSNDNPKLNELLGLKPLREDTFAFPEFLRRLKEHPEAADTSAALLVRAIKDAGEVNIDDAPAWRKPYLKMLKALGIPNYKAFEHVRGSQRTVARTVKFLEAAAQNGYQLRQMLTLVGGPGCGKSFLADAIKAVLEGQTVYAVKGCPVNENPINLLKLLPTETLQQIAEETGLGTALFDHLKVAGEPCAHCWKQAMGDSNTPSLVNVQVDILRLTSRSGGISTWMPSADGQGCDLASALRQGSRGIVDMPEAFSVPESAPGQAHELDLLLEATEGRRIPSNSEHCSKTAGFLHLDAVKIAQTNAGAWKRFIEGQADPNRFTRRTRILSVPYNTAVGEERQAYEDFIEILKARPHIDPLALQVTAFLAVASRMKKDDKDGVALNLRVRMYDGEPIVLPKKSSTIYTPSRDDGWGGALSTTASTKKNEAEKKNVEVSDLWDAAGEDEAMVGLNMGLMLSIVSQACELALNTKQKCITTMSMLNYLRQRIEIELKTPGLTKEEKAVLENCREFLKELRDRDSEPGLLEKEYRRLLRAQVLSVFSPDYEERAAKMFEVYRLHAAVSGRGETQVQDPRFKKKVDVDIKFLEEIENAMGKTGIDERMRFRRGLESEFSAVLRDSAKENEGKIDEVAITWKTMPELQKAICKRLDAEIADKVERALSDDTKLKLTEEETKLKAESISRFEQLGYCEHCLKAALGYFKEFKLWSLAGNRD
jgi:predicted Ser/Thr protein kinase